MATGYDPTTYNPNAPSPTANGTTGSQTSGSIGNAVIQSSPPSGNPYADAIQHTANWMSYVSPTSKLGGSTDTRPTTPTPLGPNNPPMLTNGMPSVATIGTGETVGQHSAVLPQTTGAPPQINTGPYQIQPGSAAYNQYMADWGGNPGDPNKFGNIGPNSGLSLDPNAKPPTTATPVSQSNANAKTLYTNPDGQIVDQNGNPTQPGPGDQVQQNKPPAATGGIRQLPDGSFVDATGKPVTLKDGDMYTKPDGTKVMYKPPTTGPSTTQNAYNAADWTQRLTAAGVQNTQEMVDLANRYSRAPGFEWVDPMVVAQYRAAVARGGENAGMSFSEWAVRNYKNKVMTPNNPALTAGMTDWATRLRNEMAKTNPNVDTQWVTPDKVMQYQSWNDQNGGVDPKTGRSLNFWEWAGTIGNGKGVYSPGSNPNGPQPPAPPADQPQPPGGGGNGGYPGGGGGAGGSSTSNSGPQGGYSPDGQTYLDNLFGALRNQYGQYNEQQMREFRHQAGLGGMQNSGAYGVNLGNTYRGLLGDENAKLAEVMAGQTDAERQRLAQIALGNISAAASRYGADRGLEGAQAGANASMFGSQLDYNKGIYGIDATREGNAMQNNLDWQRLMLQYLQQIYGTSPGAILGGQQPPTGTIIVH